MSKLVPCFTTYVKPHSASNYRTGSHKVVNFLPITRSSTCVVCRKFSSYIKWRYPMTREYSCYILATMKTVMYSWDLFRITSVHECSLCQWLRVLLLQCSQQILMHRHSRFTRRCGLAVCKHVNVLNRDDVLSCVRGQKVVKRSRVEVVAKTVLHLLLLWHASSTLSICLCKFLPG